MNVSKGSDPGNMAGDRAGAWRSLIPWMAIVSNWPLIDQDIGHKAEGEVGEEMPVARKQKFPDQFRSSNTMT